MKELQKINNLNKIKESINSIIDDRIKKESIKHSINLIENYDLPLIITIFENMFPTLYNNVNGKKYIKKYTKILKESNQLKKVFILFEDIKKPNNIEDIDSFLNETINELNNINYKQYKKELYSLSKVIKEALLINNQNVNEILKSSINENSKLNDAFSMLIQEKRNYKNIKKYTNNISIIKEYIQNNNKTIIENNKCSLHDIEKLLEGKKDWEKQLINDIIINNINNKSNEDLFIKYKTDCINSINESLQKGNTLEQKQQLNVLSEKISLKKYNNETFFDDIIKLSELKTLI